MGRVRRTNRLALEPSPYLQQHAHNPVDWYPWGEEALRRAREEDRPILLSIGYSACHWCHVMERESFEDEGIARLMNQHFVPVKVDREERPDLDRIYQTICQLVTRSGGWPLTVALTPDLRPFFVGTYFPPDPRFGRPGFRQVLEELARAWRARRAEVERVAAAWLDALEAAERPLPTRGGPPEGSAVSRGCSALAAAFDARHGGFGSAPKFPNPTLLDLFLRHASRSGEAAYREMALLTLRRMAEGGIYDQLGGGFHRYAVDAGWLVPHFEKMLYDNALLVPLYLAAWQLTGDGFYARVARETLTFLLREMQSPEGGFYATLDADSEGQEGRYYTWTAAEVDAAAGEDGPALRRHFGVSSEGNFQDGRSVLHVADPGVDAAVVARGKARLLAARERRVRPGRDEKVLAGWNGLAISALARAARILREPRWAEAADAAADFVLGRLHRDGRLLRRWKDGHAGIAGTLEDYAFLAAGLIDLYEATFDARRLAAAADLTRAALDRFWSDGEGFYLTEPSPDLVIRPREATDGATPSPTAVAVTNLLRLHPFTGDDRFPRVANAALELHGTDMERNPWGTASLLAALDLAAAGSTEVLLVAPPDHPQADEWLGRLARRYLPTLVLSRVPPEGPPGPAVARLTGSPEHLPPIWEGRGAPGERPTVYVCRQFTCSLPLQAWEEVEEWLG